MCYRPVRSSPRNNNKVAVLSVHAEGWGVEERPATGRCRAVCLLRWQHLAGWHKLGKHNHLSEIKQYSCFDTWCVLTTSTSGSSHGTQSCFASTGTNMFTEMFSIGLFTDSNSLLKLWWLILVGFCQVWKANRWINEATHIYISTEQVVRWPFGCVQK